MDISVGAMAPAHVTAGHIFAFTTEPGRHDVIAYGNTKLLIQRDLQLEADTVLAPVHVTSEGTSMLSATVAIAVDPDEWAPSIYDVLTTSNGTYFSWLDENPAGALFVPLEVLGPGDKQEFTVGWYRYTSPTLATPTRTLVVSDPTRLDETTLLPKVTAATRHGDAVGVTWVPIADFYTTATIATLTSDDSEQRVTASKKWLERHGKSELDFDLAVDGYDSSWVTTLPLQLTLERWSPGARSLTSFYYPEAM
ncbi:MAG: hypothetical protein ABI678_08825 [Kofleriaceae bacterium]